MGAEGQNLPKYFDEDWDKSNIWPKTEEKGQARPNIWPQRDKKGQNRNDIKLKFKMANENEGKNKNWPMDWPNFEVAPGEGKYKKLKLSTYKFCKTTGPLMVRTRQVHSPSAGVCWDMTRLVISQEMPRFGLTG